MSNSSLVAYTRISPNRTHPRNHVIDTITIHCYVGQITCERAGEGFADPARKASCNYVVDTNGRIGLICDEGDRSWCSSSSSNDNRAVTIEVASDSTDPYAVNSKAYSALINLCADICKRNGIKKLVWSTSKNDRVNHLNGCNMTVHRDFAAKACPGTYLYEHHFDIANKVNAMLAGGDSKTVVDTYAEYLLRYPKESEVNYWRVFPETQIKNGIANSEEAKRLFIKNCYLNILERKPSAAEVDGWYKRNISRAEIARGFLDSKEYKEKRATK